MASLGEELLNIVNRLQDLVFNTIGNDSLDLPQIVRGTPLDSAVEDGKVGLGAPRANAGFVASNTNVCRWS